MELSVYSFQDPVDFLNWIYLCSKRRNPRFSLRSWAKALRLNHAATLSSVLRRKQKVNPPLCKKLIRNLHLSEEQAEYFQLITLYSQEKNEQARDWLRNKILDLVPEGTYPTIALETLRLIADWKKILILEYLASSKFDPKHHILRTKFGDTIGHKEIENAISLFVRLGLVQYKEPGKPVKTSEKFTSPSDVPDIELRNLQKTFLSLAIQSLEACPVQEREVSTALITTSRKKITQAKRRLRKLRRELADFLKDENGDTVYALNVALFEVLEEKTCAH